MTAPLGLFKKPTPEQELKDLIKRKRATEQKIRQVDDVIAMMKMKVPPLQSVAPSPSPSPSPSPAPATIIPAEQKDRRNRDDGSEKGEGWLQACHAELQSLRTQLNQIDAGIKVKTREIARRAVTVETAAGVSAPPSPSPSRGACESPAPSKSYGF